MTRDEMTERYGAGTMISVHAAMEEAGFESEPHPGELFAIVHRNSEAADAWSERNREKHGNPEFYRHPRESGEMLVIYDLRPQIKRTQ